MTNYLQNKKINQLTTTELRKWIVENSATFLLNGGLLFCFDPVMDEHPRLVVPKSMTNIIMYEAHNGKFGGHFAIDKTIHKISLLYF
jgi:hypothetical protein